MAGGAAVHSRFCIQARHCFELKADLQGRQACAAPIKAWPPSWDVPCLLQANSTIAELEGLRRRSEQDEVAEEAAVKSAAVARGQARKLR